MSLSYPTGSHKSFERRRRRRWNGALARRCAHEPVCMELRAVLGGGARGLRRPRTRRRRAGNKAARPQVPCGKGDRRRARQLSMSHPQPIRSLCATLLVSAAVLGRPGRRGRVARRRPRARQGALPGLLELSRGGRERRGAAASRRGGAGGRLARRLQLLSGAEGLGAHLGHPATLDRWLTNPQALMPGTKMFFRLPAAQQRADVIAYLQQLE